MKISVIIPAYNHEKYITEAIHSVLNQSCQDFEMIIVNDGSTDATDQKILSIHDARIRYVSQENSGAHTAMNRGIALSRGEYISILNSDDVYVPKRLEACLNFLETHSNYSVVLSTVEGVDQSGMPVKQSVTPQIKAWLDWYAGALPFFDEDRFYPHAFVKNIMITTSNLFARRTCFEACGGFKALRYAHDWDMLLRLSSRYRIHLIKEDLLKYRIHPENTVHERESKLKVQFEVNWLIVENLKAANPDFSPIEMLESLRNNHDLSFEVMFSLLLMKDHPVFNDLIDFNHPLTAQLLQLLQSGIRLAAVFALPAQVQDLLIGNAWLASQREAWEKVAAEREQGIRDLQAHIRELQAGNAWLASQCEAWQKASIEQGEVIIERDQVIAKLTERLEKIQSHIGVRLLNRLSGRKLFS